MRLSNTLRMDHRQAGIVLPLTLFLLVILSILGIMAMRNATVGTQTINGVRSYTVSEMAAESGLRYCEEVAKEAAFPSTPAKYTAEIAKIALQNKGNSTPVQGANDAYARWSDKSFWAASSVNRITVSSSVTAGRNYKYPPQCIIEKMSNTKGDSYLVTARGIGNDADYDVTSGKVKSGSEVWLQSILTPGSDS